MGVLHGPCRSGQVPVCGIGERNRRGNYQTLTVNQINEWDTYLNAEQQTIRHVCVVKVENEFLPENVSEGASIGWFTIPEAPQLDCTYLTAKDLRKFDVLYRCDSSNK